MKDLKADLKADLLADMQPASVEPPTTPVLEAPLPQAMTDSTPALSVQWTPLRWSRPKVVKAKGGIGKAVKLGPLKLELAVRD